MRTQSKSPPTHAAMGNANTTAANSSHSATIRTSGVNRVTGTKGPPPAPGSAETDEHNAAPDQWCDRAVRSVQDITGHAGAQRGSGSAHQHHRLAAICGCTCPADEDDHR